ncbi:MAG: glycosyltransferase family 9 protein [Calditrichia bacterium]
MVVTKILVLQTAFIGDVILSIPLVEALHQRWPEGEIHFLTIPNSVNIVENIPFIKRLWIYDKRDRDRGLIGLLRLSKQLRQEKFDLVITPHRSFRSALLLWLARIPVRIGFDKSAGWFLYNRVVHYVPDIHEIDRNLRLLSPLGIHPTGKILPKIFCTDSDKSVVDNWLKQQRKLNDRPLIVFAPGSIWATKRWPATYWGKLANLLFEKGYAILIIGSKQDQFLLSEIERNSEVPLLNAMGVFTLRQSSELIGRSRLLITNDSAPTHMGVAMDVPVLTIFGPTVPRFGFYPYNSSSRVAEVSNLSCRPCSIHGGKKCPLNHFKCMKDLQPEMVFTIALEMLHENTQD